jgi:OmpA-OmpF porin, OOP family
MIARSRGSISLLILGATLLVAPLANAQEQSGYAQNHIDPSERGSRWFVLDSIDIQGHGRLALGVVNDYSYRPLVAYNFEGSAVSSIVRNQYVMHLGASVALADRVRLGIGVPLQLIADGHDGVINGVAHRAATDTAVGDVRLSLDGRVVGAPGDAASVALGAELFAPSGSTEAYMGDGKPRFQPRVAFAGRTSSFAYAAKVGVMFRSRHQTFGDSFIGTSLTYGVSAGALLNDGKILIGPELFGSTVLTDDAAFTGRATPLEALLGTHIDLGNNLRAGAGVGAGLTRGYGAPVFRGLLSFEWIPGDAKPEKEEVKDDRDGDGVPDCEDACGFVAGQKSVDPAKNGCPADSDSDGVPDNVDACPNVVGTASADASTNGCPQDLDRDGVLDNEDACPREVGPRSSDPRTNGCPARDRDGDGVIDAEDACPQQPGPRSADPKTNGCPDPDRDKDGVLNDVDACPDEPGKPDPDPKKNGCPKAFLKDGTIKITDQVKFKTNSAEIVPGKESEDILNAVLGVLKAHTEIKSLRVEGHTDNKGDAARNKTLSQARAESVAKWLTDHGIEKGQLTSSGFGAEKPIDTNDTDAGRTNNRRVEFHVEEGSGR